MHFQGVAPFGFFDIKRAHQGIAAFRVNIRLLQMAGAFLVLSAGIPRFRNHGVARMNMGHGLLVRRKDAGVMVRVNLMGFGQQRTMRQQSNRENENRSKRHLASSMFQDQYYSSSAAVKADAGPRPARRQDWRPTPW